MSSCPFCFFCQSSLTLEVHRVTVPDGYVAACAKCASVTR